MKNMKKVLCSLLALVMVFAMNFTTAFAAESNKTNNVPDEVTTVNNSDDEGIMPRVYDTFHADIPAYSSVTLSGFPVPERYMAFEASATVMGGGATSQTYTVDLQIDGYSITGITLAANGSSNKLDWIDLESTNNSVGFKMTNNANIDITVHIIYYSWS